MTMTRAPGFWFRSPPTAAARLLAPVGAAYARATARRLAQGARARVGVPVICVGNLNAGGTGKTPTVIHLQMALAARGVAVHVVSRGYGGSATGPLRVDERRHDAALTGRTEQMVLNGAYLVDRDRAVEWRAAVDRAVPGDVTVEVTGPWIPYSFVAEEDR